MSLINYLEALPDPRTDINIRHNLVDVVFLVFSAVMSGASGWKSIQEFGDTQLDWLRQHRDFEYGIPRRHCIANIIKALDSELLLQAVLGWVNEQRQQEGKTVIALDGKTLRSAWTEDIQKALHIVSAFDVTNGLALYQESTNRKGKEAEVTRHVIDALALENAVITLDALHCQKSTMNKIVQGKGDFVIQLKANRRELYESVMAEFKQNKERDYQEQCITTNQGHGRTERRQFTQRQSELPTSLKQKWPHIKTLIELKSERTKKGKTTVNTRYYVSSLALDAEQVSTYIRDHWAIENNLHWVLDVVFREDELKVTDPTGAKHLALFNRAALGVIKQHKGKKDSMAAKRRMAAWSSEFRAELLFG